MIRLLAVICLLLAMLGPAHAGAVHILLSEDSDAYRQAAEDIKSRIDSAPLRDSIRISSLAAFTPRTEATDLIVTVGAAAAAYSQREHPETPQLYSYIEKSALPSPPVAPWAAVVLDQPLQRLFDTARQVVSDRYRNKLVIAVSETNLPLREDIAALSEESDISLELVVVAEDADPAKIIDKALFNAGALIAARDPRIWSGEHAKWMLYQSYKYNVPVIGYSRSFLKAGALVSVYTSLSDAAATTGRLISDWSENPASLAVQGVTAPPATVSVNNNIARALKIDLPDELSQGEEAHVRE